MSSEYQGNRFKASQFESLGTYQRMVSINRHFKGPQFRHIGLGTHDQRLLRLADRL